MTDGSKYRDAEWLREQYVEKQFIAAEIAEECDCSERTVQRWLHKHDIDTRAGGSLGERKIEFKQLKDASWLREQYISQEKSQRQIAKEIGCSKSTVQNWIRKHDVQTDEFQNGAIGRLEDRQWLHNQYVKNGKSGYEIAEICGTCTSTVYRWIRKHNIDIKYNGKVSGKEHWKYSGGSTPYGAGWNETKRQAVRERDGYTCQDPRCSVTQAEHRDAHGEKLHVHHLQKARHIEDDAARNAKENLIALCRDCHRRWEKMADAGIVPEFVDKAAEQGGETA